MGKGNKGNNKDDNKGFVKPLDRIVEVKENNHVPVPTKKVDIEVKKIEPVIEVKEVVESSTGFNRLKRASDKYKEAIETKNAKVELKKNYFLKILYDTLSKYSLTQEEMDYFNDLFCNDGDFNELVLMTNSAGEEIMQMISYIFGKLENAYVSAQPPFGSLNSTKIRRI